MSPAGGFLTAPPAGAAGPTSPDDAGVAPAVGAAHAVLSRADDLARSAGSTLRALVRAGQGTPLSVGAADDGPPVTVPRDPAREAAERELAKRLYHENDPGLLERALNAFWDWVDGLLGAASTATPGGVLGLLAVLLAVAAVAVALWWRLGTPRRDPTATAALFEDRPRSAADHRATAEAHAARGHWNQAVQERMRALVRALEERALLDDRPGRTADEAATEAGRTLPTRAAPLRRAARAFDDVTYGGRTATEETYRDLADLDRALDTTRPTLTPTGPSSRASTPSKTGTTADTTGTTADTTRSTSRDTPR